MKRSAAGGRIVLTDRDDELLTFVGLVGPGVTTEHLTVAFFSSPDRSRRRTKQLVDAGYLASWLIDSRAPRVLTLTSRSLAYLTTKRPDLAPRLRRARPVEAQALRHASAVIWARMTFASLAEAGQLVVETTGHRKMLCCPPLAPLSPGVTPPLASPAPAGQPDILRRAVVQLLRFVVPHEPAFASFDLGRFGVLVQRERDFGVMS